MNTAIATTTAATVSPFIQKLQQQQQPQKPQTSKEAIATNVKALAEQLEEGHSEALTRVAEMYSWNRPRRKVNSGGGHPHVGSRNGRSS